LGFWNLYKHTCNFKPGSIPCLFWEAILNYKQWKFIKSG
jgi:hypothetical protein